MARLGSLRSFRPNRYKMTTQPWSTLVEGGKERYRPPGKLTLELVHANQNKLLCLWTMQLTKWAGKVPYLLILNCSMPEPIDAVNQGNWSLSIKFRLECFVIVK